MTVLAKPFDVQVVAATVRELVGDGHGAWRDLARTAPARVGVEPAAGLLAEVARLDEVDEHLRRRELRLPEARPRARA